MMKKIIFFAVFAAWFVTLGVMAQNRPPRNRISQEQFNAIRDQFDQNAPSNKVYRLFPLANKLLTFNSFDKVVRELLNVHNGFKFRVDPFDGGELNAKCDLCELQAINCDGVPERIDTLTLFIRVALKKEVLKDSLEKAHYTLKKPSSTFDWWQRNDGTNLAVYYNYSDEFKTAMLFARPKVDEVEPAGPTEEPTGTNIEETDEQTMGSELHFEYVPFKKVTTDNSWKLTIEITFPEAKGSIAEKLNDEALRSPLLASLVDKKPKLSARMSLRESLEKYADQMDFEFWSRQPAFWGNNQEFFQNCKVTIQEENITREGVVTYINSMKAKWAESREDDYRIVVNFNRANGEMLTFDKVFKKKAKSVLYEWLKTRYINGMDGRMEIPEMKDLKKVLERSLDNFVLGRERVTFIPIINDGQGLTEPDPDRNFDFSFTYSDLQDFLR